MLAAYLDDLIVSYMDRREFSREFERNRDEYSREDRDLAVARVERALVRTVNALI